MTDGFKPLAEMHYKHALPAMQQASVNLPAAKRQMLFDAMHRAIDTAMATATAMPETLSPAEDGSGDPRALMMQ